VITGQHLPALNGLRAIAVLAVLAYHLQLGWASGGYLGVDLFFVLSGFLITTLLLEEWIGTGTLSLTNFWARRAKRLLPALFLVVAALAVYLVVDAHFGGAGANGLVDLSALRGDALSTLLYVSNWHAIYAHQSYFAQFSTPSPLQHTWSLAIEEQFYLVWPPVLLLLLRLSGRSWRQLGLLVAVAMALLSAGLMALLFHPGGDPTRSITGPTPGCSISWRGASVAFLAAARPPPGPAVRRTLHGPLRWRRPCWPSSGSPRARRGDCRRTGCLKADSSSVPSWPPWWWPTPAWLDRGPFARVLSVPPLHFLGTISYGIYLWHWPIFVYLTATRTGLATAPLDLVRVAATLVVATASYYLVERPIRQAHVRLWLAPVAAVATAVVLCDGHHPGRGRPECGGHHLEGQRAGRHCRGRIGRVRRAGAHQAPGGHRVPAAGHVAGGLGDARCLLRHHGRAHGHRPGHRGHQDH
jgi:peptidoglycan/LPS O-acetylase OafA/YrhL